MFHFDSYDNSLVIDGFENGIADSPHTGLADMRNCNIISVPGEASVNFATSLISPPAITGSVTSANTGTDTLTYSSIANIEARMAIVFSAVTVGGLSTNTVYWLGNTGTTTSKVYTDILLNNLVDLTSTGTGTFTTYTVSIPKYFTFEAMLPGSPHYWMVDSAGLVWTNTYVSGTSSFWTYSGNTTLTNTHGNGIVYYQASNSTGYVFVFRNGLIDYIPVTGTPTWVYGWKPSDGTTGNTGTVLKTAAGANNPHEAFVAPDNRVYFTDSNWIGIFYETTPGTAFVPTNTATYTFSQNSLLPSTDLAQCLTFLGTSLLIGGVNNIIYPWDRFSTNFAYPILLPEYNIQKMITVNTTTFILVGNRGRIYYTNGTNAQLYKKIPDHISGTLEPYFTWGGLTSQKNQLYFSVKAVTNAQVAIPQYGGIWAIDLDTKAIRLTNKLSYGTYAGYATALIPNFSTAPAGTGLIIGWDNGSSGYGIDQTSSNPYINSEASIDSDLIPIGTFNQPRDFTKIEYRLTKPLVSGESITIKTRLIFNTQDTGYTTTLTDSTVNNYSNIGDINFKNAQWVQFQIVINSTTSSPSYVRLKHIRILGLTGPTLANSQQLSL